MPTIHTSDGKNAELNSEYKNASASSLIHSGKGRLFGVFVASASTATIKIYDGTDATGAVLVNTFTPTAATYYEFPKVRYKTGLYIEVSGTIDYTVFYKESD